MDLGTALVASVAIYVGGSLLVIIVIVIVAIRRRARFHAEFRERVDGRHGHGRPMTDAEITAYAKQLKRDNPRLWARLAEND